MKAISKRFFPEKNINKKYFILYFKLIIFLLKIVLSNLVNKNYINYDSEIHLVIRGNGNQKLLSDYFYTEPSKVYINGHKIDSCKKTCYLKEEQSNITLIFKKNLLIVIVCSNIWRI